MKHKNYIEIINKTAVYPQQVDNFGKAYCFFGLAGEWGEMLEDYDKLVYGYKEPLEQREASLSKEIGDVIWYITGCCKEYDLDAIEYLKIISETDGYSAYNASEEILEDASYIGFDKMMEPLKKFYRDGKKIDNEMKELLRVCCTYLGYIISFENLNLDTILTANYEKLMKRRDTGTLHGDGSNREEATNG